MSGIRLKSLLALALLALGASCSKPKSAEESASAASAGTLPPAAISGLPVTVTLKQRSTAAIPGADDQLSIAVEDITGGQTTVSVRRGESDRLLGPQAMRTGESAIFQYAGQDFALKLGKLDNALVGEDFATFTVSGGEPSPIGVPGELSESRKIQLLIGSIESLQNAKFRRNGKDYDAKEAAAHLRRKLDAAGDRVKTAEQFIEHLATKSSVSGEPYEIRYADGKVVKTADFLRAELKKLGKNAE